MQIDLLILFYFGFYLEISLQLIDFEWRYLRYLLKRYTSFKAYCFCTYGRNSNELFKRFVKIENFIMLFAKKIYTKLYK